MYRRRIRQPTLSGRLLRAILGIVMLVFGLTAIGNYLLLSNNARGQLENKADEHLGNLSHSLELPLWSLDKNLIHAIALSYLQNDLIVAIKITEAEGQTEIFSQQKEDITDPFQRSAVIRYRGQLLGRVDLTLSSSLLRHQRAALLRYSLVTAGLIVIVLSLLTGYLLRRLLKRPLLTLQQGITRLASGDYSDELRVEVRELQPIATAFTNMARQVEEREQELQQIADASWEAILIHEHGLFLHANEQFFALYGYRPEQLIGHRSLDKVIAPGHLDDVSNLVRNNDLGPYETIGLNAKGDEFPIEVRARQIEQKGRTLRMVAIRDLRERKHLEELMIQSEKMISIGGLAAGMAHEINNPLAGILQSAQVFSNRLNPALQKNQDAAKEAGTDIDKINRYMEDRGLLNMLTNIRTSGQRAAKIVDNILSFSRKSESLLLETDMTALILETLHLAESDYDLKKKFDFRNIEIIKQFDPELPHVPCEPSQIQQVLLNLLKNGAYSMTRDNTEKPRFTLRSIKEDRWLRLEVEDNGPGMEEEVRRRIFEPFFTTKSVGEGTGLGLSVSYFIITQTHRGELTVQSNPNGTLFTIRLPLERENQPL